VAEKHAESEKELAYSARFTKQQQQKLGNSNPEGRGTGGRREEEEK
jgi:hypothetical protein